MRQLFEDDTKCVRALHPPSLTDRAATFVQSLHLDRNRLETTDLHRVFGFGVTTTIMTRGDNEKQVTTGASDRLLANQNICSTTPEVSPEGTKPSWTSLSRKIRLEDGIPQRGSP